MSGETHLNHLLHALSPSLSSQTYVFCCVADWEPRQLEKLRPLASFREREGVTLILEKAMADQEKLAYEGLFRCITLEVHSSLQAVGLTAAVANKLTSLGISANVVAAYYHDHIFIPTQEAERALAGLRELSRNGANH